MRRRIAAALAALLLSLALLPPAMAGEDDQDRVRDLRQQGKIQPLSVIVERLTAKHPGRILQVELENEHGTRVYEIQMVLKGGILRTFHVDAHTGEILSTTRREDW